MMRVRLALTMAITMLLVMVAIAQAKDDTTIVETTDLMGLQQEVEGVDAKVSQMQTDGAVNDAQVQSSLDALADAVDGVSDAVASADEGRKADADRLDEIDQKQDEQTELLKGIKGNLEEEPEAEQAELTEVESLLELMPEDSPSFVVDFIYHPFLWGVAAGSVGYVITLMQVAFYRLLGLR